MNRERRMKGWGVKYSIKRSQECEDEEYKMNGKGAKIALRSKSKERTNVYTHLQPHTHPQHTPTHTITNEESKLQIFFMDGPIERPTD